MPATVSISALGRFLSRRFLFLAARGGAAELLRNPSSPAKRLGQTSPSAVGGCGDGLQRHLSLSLPHQSQFGVEEGMGGGGGGGQVRVTAAVCCGYRNKWTEPSGRGRLLRVWLLASTRAEERDGVGEGGGKGGEGRRANNPTFSVHTG